MPKTTLYQFSLCPFCNKVRAALELKGVEFDTVEVSPRNKKELPPLPEGTPKKVPVLQHGDDIIADSTHILEYIEENFPGKVSFQPTDPDEQSRAREIEEWIDDELIVSLPTVIYGTRKEASVASRIVAKSSKLGMVQKLGMQLAGSLIMHQVAKRILKKHGKTDAHGWVKDNVQQFSTWLGDKKYVTGDSISMGDVAMHGALTCLKEFPIFSEVMTDSTVSGWYQRLDAVRQENRVS